MALSLSFALVGLLTLSFGHLLLTLLKPALLAVFKPSLLNDLNVTGFSHILVSMQTLKSELELYMRALCDEEYYDEQEGIWLFRNGGQCSICTDSALRVIRQFGGIVAGYFAIESPLAKIGLPMVEGHDFALIGSRWLG